MNKTLVAFLVSALMLAPAFAGGAAKAAPKTASAQDAFLAACEKAWIRNTAKCGHSPLEYAAGEEIAFEFAFAGVTNAVPAGKYFLSWKRTGSDGQVEEGKIPLVDTKPLKVTSKSDIAGFVRLDVTMTGADSKPVEVKSGGKTRYVSCTVGAAVDLAKIVPEPDQKTFAASFKALKSQLAKTPMKKTLVTEAAIAGAAAGTKGFNLAIPYDGTNVMTAVLSVPEAALAGKAKVPARVRYRAVDDVQKQFKADPKLCTATEVVLFAPIEKSLMATNDVAAYRTAVMKAVRTVQYLKTRPEWDGKELTLEGDGAGVYAAIAGAAGESGVTEVKLTRSWSNPMWVPTFSGYEAASFARQIPSTCVVKAPGVVVYDEVEPAVRLWKALKCQRVFEFVGCNNGKKERWEKLAAVEYRRMTPENALVIGKGPSKAFKNLETEFRDHVVLELIVDYTNSAAFPLKALEENISYVKRDAKPLAVYAVIPEKKIKDKLWQNTLSRLAAAKGETPNIPFPIYLNAGMVLPPPAKLPWFNVVDHTGVVRYSGEDVGAAWNAASAALAKMPPVDEMFAYAKPELLKAAIEKQMTLKHLSGSKLCKFLEQERKRTLASAPDYSAEAEHLVFGMHQACEIKFNLMSKKWGERAGLCYNDIRAMLADWPELATHPKAKYFERMVAEKPEVEKLAKLEKELARLLKWNPLKPADQKKKDAEVAGFRNKLQKLTNSKDASVQGEALAILFDLDNPPQDDQQGEAQP